MQKRFCYYILDILVISDSSHPVCNIFIDYVQNTRDVVSRATLIFLIIFGCLSLKIPIIIVIPMFPVINLNYYMSLCYFFEAVSGFGNLILDLYY